MWLGVPVRGVGNIETRLMGHCPALTSHPPPSRTEKPQSAAQQQDRETFCPDALATLLRSPGLMMLGRVTVYQQESSCHCLRGESAGAAGQAARPATARPRPRNCCLSAKSRPVVSISTDYKSDEFHPYHRLAASHLDINRQELGADLFK